jgi:hypothetical protein
MASSFFFFFGCLSNCGCVVPMRILNDCPYYLCVAGGILAAFLQAALLNNTTSFDAALAHPELAPVLLERPESYGKLPQNLNWQLPFSRMNEDQNQLVKSAHQD